MYPEDLQSDCGCGSGAGFCLVLPDVFRNTGHGERAVHASASKSGDVVLMNRLTWRDRKAGPYGCGRV